METKYIAKDLSSVVKHHLLTAEITKTGDIVSPLHIETDMDMLNVYFNHCLSKQSYPGLSDASELIKRYISFKLSEKYIPVSSTLFEGRRVLTYSRSHGCIENDKIVENDGRIPGELDYLHPVIASDPLIIFDMFAVLDISAGRGRLYSENLTGVKVKSGRNSCMIDIEPPMIDVENQLDAITTHYQNILSSMPKAHKKMFEKACISVSESLNVSAFWIPPVRSLLFPSGIENAHARMDCRDDFKSYECGMMIEYNGTIFVDKTYIPILGG